jgi:hypothetical protein
MAICYLRVQAINDLPKVNRRWRGSDFEGLYRFVEANDALT